VVPENIHTHPKEGYRGGGDLKTQIFKGKHVSKNWNVQSNWRGRGG